MTYTKHMPTPPSTHPSGSPHRRARLFRNGRSQAVRIPREYEFPGDEVLLYREGDRLIIEPVPARSGLLELLQRLEPRRPLPRP